LYSWGSREIKATVSTEGYDLVFVARLSTMWWMGSGRAIPTLVDIDDVIHLGLQQALRSEKNPLRKLAKWWHYRIVRHAEVSTLRFVSKAFVCSEVDSEAVRSDKVAVLPNIFPDRGQLEREPVVSASPGLLFVGALVYKPNREAIAFFVRNIFPLIRETLPEATLTVVGRSGRDQAFEWARVSGITFLGTVRDIDPIIEASAVEVCPILYGAGTRIKILEALSFGKPVVSTTVGAHGIALDEESGLFRADSPEAFAERCITLLRSSGLRRDLAPRAREGVRSLYSQARVDRIVAETIQEVVCRRH
jgi:glycosyltransferase involved in cell wall biosynthesis